MYNVKYIEHTRISHREIRDLKFFRANMHSRTQPAYGFYLVVSTAFYEPRTCGDQCCCCSPSGEPEPKGPLNGLLSPDQSEAHHCSCQSGGCAARGVTYAPLAAAAAAAAAAAVAEAVVAVAGVAVAGEAVAVAADLLRTAAALAAGAAAAEAAG